MATQVKLEIDRESYENVYKALRELTLETWEANRALREFAAEIKRLKRKFHPFVWWIITMSGKMTKERKK